MAEPYGLGDQVAWLTLDRDKVLVQRATVIEPVVEVGPNRFEVTTDRGREFVDSTGEGNLLLPLDEELWKETEQHPEGWAVVEEGRVGGLELVVTVEFREPTVEQGLDGDGREH